MPVESDKWGWKHVSVIGRFEKGSGTKRWKCNHCNHSYNGSYSRVRAHLLGFNGLGVKPCPAIDTSVREAFTLLDKDRVSRKLMKKKAILPSENTMRKRSLLSGIKHYTENVDNTVARFFYVDGLNVNVVDSTYFKEMVRIVGAFGPNYELPSMEQLSGSLLCKEKMRLEKALALAKDSWAQTGCTILCVNRLDGSLGCFCVNFFVATTTRGVMFLKEVDIIEGDVPDNLFIDELTNVIDEVGPSNVLQVITRLTGQVSDVFESVILSKFPHVFWSHCTSHSVLLLMEEIANLDWMKDVVSSAREIDKCVTDFKRSSHVDIDVLEGSMNRVSQKFAPSYSLVRKIVENKSNLCELIVREEWKHWILNAPGIVFNVKAIITSDDFWGKAELMLDVFEPFVAHLASLDIDKSAMGDVYNWRVLSIETLRGKGIKDDRLLNQVESLIKHRWDNLFSPLHGAAYILHPKHFGKGQGKNQSLMKAWNATLERYESGFDARRVLREELGVFWRAEASFGQEDASDCRKNMEPVTWWENFGFETPRLQTLAIKILSQIPSAAIMCEESWQLCDSMSCREAVEKLGFGSDQAKDFVFVRNNLRLQTLKHGKVGRPSGSGSAYRGNSCRNCI